MGEIIRKDAAIDDIIADVKTSYTNAIAKGGKWAQIAVDRISEVVDVITITEDTLAAAEKTYTPMESTLIAFDAKADALIASKYDEIWNIVGRPANDAALSILFPQGSSYYTEGSNEEQPDRMNILAELLVRGIHKKLPREKAQSIAAEISDCSKEYQAIIDTAKAPKARVTLLRQVKIAVARSAQLSLASFKRFLKADGFSETEIHQVIPDRPRPVKTPPTQG